MSRVVTRPLPADGVDVLLAERGSRAA